MKALTDAVEDEVDIRYVSPYAMAGLYLDARDPDNAMRWLEVGYENRDTALIWVNVDPAFDTLRSDPRFEDLLRRMNFPE